MLEIVVLERHCCGVPTRKMSSEQVTEQRASTYIVLNMADWSIVSINAITLVYQKSALVYATIAAQRA